MTTVIRYVKNTTTAANVNTQVDSTGADYQLVSIDVTTAAGIAAGANANVLTWTGAGKIKAIVSVFMRRAATGEIIPMGAVAQNTHSTLTLDATEKIINIALLGGATVIPTNTVISFLLVIGNY